MKLSEKQLDLLKRRNLIVLATSDLKGNPRAIIVELNKVEDNKIIITDNQMEKTKDNILENNNISILAFEEDYHYGIKISGSAEYYTKGEYFDYVKNLETNKGYNPKGTIVIDIKEIIEFE